MSRVHLVLRPEAQSDIEEALAWYHDRDHRLVARLLDELDAALTRIIEAPDQFPMIESSVRRALLHRFPYSVYFVADRERRHPAAWKREAAADD